MPNKRNPDIAELTRAKAAHVIGAQTNGYALLKGLPTSYDSDLHEMKTVVLRAFDELTSCLDILPYFVSELEVDLKQAQALLNKGHLLATEIADELASQGVPFREAYSQVAALTQMERQKRSAGTFVCGAAFWLTRMNADSALVPTTGPLAFAPEAGIRASRRTIVGTTVGYAHTFVFWHKGFIHLALLAGAGYSDQTRTMGKNGERAADTGVSALMEFKGGIGFNGDRWYTGLTLAYYLNEDADDHVAMLGSMYGSARWAIGYRLGRPNIKGLDKVGL